MKKIVLPIATALLIASCSLKTIQIGKVNMISNRNVDSKADYVVIKNYVGGSKKELKKLKAETLEQAIDNVVKNVPGGEFLKNVKIYLVSGKYYAVEGDVWGYMQSANFKGFRVGDNVQWKENLKTRKGKIVDLKDDRTATIKEENGELKIVKYDDLLRVSE